MNEVIPFPMEEANGLPCVAELLTPVLQWDTVEPFVAFRQVVSQAEGWGGDLANTLASHPRSSWIVVTAAAIAAGEFFRRRKLGAARRSPAAQDVPGITGPDELAQ
jgi:hypothetical protein